MTGDGTNDAPALAQADVGVAMNTGTQAAKEAGNMVDLDSNPTKLIEIVEIGKQLLITRGSLTTFSIANDVAKYFAIIPAMFAGAFPELDRLNVMDLSSPRTAILSAVIFNALIIVALIPLALRGVKLRAARRRRAPAPQPARLRRSAASSRRSSASSSSTSSSPESGSLADAPPAASRAPRASLRSPCSSASLYPLVVTGVAQVAFGDKADGSLVERDGVVVGSSLIGQGFEGDECFQPRPSAAGDGYDGTRQLPPPTSAPPTRTSSPTVEERVAAYRSANGLAAVAPCPSTPSPPRAPASTPTSRSPTPACRRRACRRARGLSEAEVLALVDEHTERRTLGFLGEERVNVLELNLALDAAG